MVRLVLFLICCFPATSILHSQETQANSQVQTEVNGVNLTPAEYRMFTYLNDFRSRSHLPPLPPSAFQQRLLDLPPITAETSLPQLLWKSSSVLESDPEINQVAIEPLPLNPLAALSSATATSQPTPNLAPNLQPNLPPHVPAPLTILAENQYPNSGGYCMWACLDTLARHHGIQPLIGITRREWEKTGHATLHPGYQHLVTKELQALGVAYKTTPAKFPGQRGDLSLLEQYASSLGVIVSFYKGNPYYQESHAVFVTEYTATQVTWYDPNRKFKQLPKTTLTSGRDWFDQWWSGESLVVFKEPSDAFVNPPFRLSTDPTPNPVSVALPPALQPVAPLDAAAGSRPAAVQPPSINSRPTARPQTYHNNFQWKRW